LGELLEYPTLATQVDRERAGQLGVSVAEVAQALAPATSSSRFTTPVYPKLLRGRSGWPGERCC
jgi:multidrug efflux pump subunit AcrB